MSKPITIRDEYCLFDMRDGSALLATKYMRLDELLEENRKHGIETVFRKNPSSKIRRMLMDGFVVATIRDDCPYCTVYTLDKSE
jgi:hypothetical protein